MTHPAVFRPLQARFLTIPQAPLCYWLRDRFLDLLARQPCIGDVAVVEEGYKTANNDRFLRFFWEVDEEAGWIHYEKGEGYARWAGLSFRSLDWRNNGIRLLSSNGIAVPRPPQNNAKGLTYSEIARGSLGFRLMVAGSAFDFKAHALFPVNVEPSRLCAVLNARHMSYLARSLSPSIYINQGYVARLPYLETEVQHITGTSDGCIFLKRQLVALDSTERTFGGIPVNGGSLAEAWRKLSDEAEAVAAVLHTLEGLSEREVLAAYGIAGEDLQAVLDETGTPAGWFPLISGYDKVPSLHQGLEVPVEVFAPLANEPRQTLSPQELADLKRRVRALYEAGPGAKVEEEEEPASDDAEESEAVVAGAYIPIPPETFLEELSEKLEVHPISVYWLLRDLRDKDGVICGPELRRFVEDYVSLTVLRLLGHRWPRQIEAGEPLPPWADADGILPLTPGAGQPTLLERMRQRIAEDFGASRVNAIEQEFEQITGRSLGVWLATEFFPRHVSQFKKRPIAWQIESSRSDGKRGRRGRSNAPPAFSCLVYYHHLDADLLPKLRSQYLGPLRVRFQTELAGLERLDTRTGDQDERRVQLEMLIEELKDFDARLEQVITRGFSSPALDAVGKKEPLDRWASRDGTTPHPQTREAFLAQEAKYDPDLNDGVRVNIAPLQKAGLLAADVLATKDVEKAIADRAEWRADERRWCREGKLPQPGWWGAGAARGTFVVVESERAKR